MQNLHSIKKEICDIGSRIYKKGFASANDGNISYRFSENEVVCTPTQVSKGFMKPDDLCIVDMDGNQISGRRKRTSEILLHLEIMKTRPEVKSVVHCHPPHATAFGIAREPVPQCILPEIEIWLGEIPIARYDTPGGKNFAETILPFVNKSEVIILANHGTVSWGDTVESAYFKTEMLDAYCKMLILARTIGSVSYFNKPETEELLEVKQTLGVPDPRIGMENCDLCANDVFRESWVNAGVQQRAFNPPSFKGQAPSAASPAVDQEALIQAITDRVLEALSKKGQDGKFPLQPPELARR